MRRKTTSEFIVELSNINPNIEVLGQYEGAYTPVQCRCIKCNHVWMAVPHNILTKSGCPNCSHRATSFIEQFILLSLQEAFGSKNVLGDAIFDRLEDALRLISKEIDFNGDVLSLKNK